MCKKLKEKCETKRITTYTYTHILYITNFGVTFREFHLIRWIFVCLFMIVFDFTKYYYLKWIVVVWNNNKIHENNINRIKKKKQTSKKKKKKMYVRIENSKRACASVFKFLFVWNLFDWVFYYVHFMFTHNLFGPCNETKKNNNKLNKKKSRIESGVTVCISFTCTLVYLN